MPNEPPETVFKDKIRHKAYPCREHAGVIWVYMGRHPPPLPELEWTMVPDENRYLAKRIQNCNFAQALEGEIDQSHNSFLHAPGSQLKPEVFDGTTDVDLWRKRDTHPHFSAFDTNYGVLIGAQRDIDKVNCYWRLTQFLLPFYVMTGPYGENPTRHTRMWVPMDDDTTMLMACNFHPLRPLTEQEIDRLRAARARDLSARIISSHRTAHPAALGGPRRAERTIISSTANSNARNFSRAFRSSGRRMRRCRKAWG